LDRLWSPWRNNYVTSGKNSGEPQGCVFCLIQSHPEQDSANFVLYRASRSFIVLNIYPYISGHLLIVPNEHLSDLDALAKETSDELMDLTKRSQTLLREVYQPSGYNIGLNLGAAAGAGIQDHVHIHVMPRWAGDTNFMTSIGETRVIPEDLNVTYSKLRGKF